MTSAIRSTAAHAMAIIAAQVVWLSDARAQQTVTVRVLIEESAWNGCSDATSAPDIYFNVFINGVKHSSYDNQIKVNIAPFVVSEEFSESVAVSQGSVAITIQEWDADSGLAGSDDHCDLHVSSSTTRDLTMTLDLAACQISGDPMSGSCGDSLVVMEGQGDDPRSYIKFKVWVDEPPRAAGLSVRCMHAVTKAPPQPPGPNSLWPQPGDVITITAEALDGNADLMSGFVDGIEIWVDNSLQQSTATSPGLAGANTLSYVFTAPTGPASLTYRCRAYDLDPSTNSEAYVSSGWRTVQVGTAPALPGWSGRAIPVLYTGVPNSRIDVVFIPDRASFPAGATDPAFLENVYSVVRDSYYANNTTIRAGGRTFLWHQDAINFWIAQDSGLAVDWCSDCSRCTCGHVAPAGWDTEYSFAEAGAILHTNTAMRNSADRNRRLFSGRQSRLTTFLHEFGHQPFGLSDEYYDPTPNFPYFVSDPYPNVYSSLQACSADPLASTTSGSCAQIGNGTATVDWFRLDDQTGNDLMEDSGNHAAQPADARQIDWLFGECSSSDC